MFSICRWFTRSINMSWRMLSVFSDFIFIRDWRVDFLLLEFSSREKTSNWLSFFTVFTVILRRAATTTTTDVMISFLICSVSNWVVASFARTTRCCRFERLVMKSRFVAICDFAVFRAICDFAEFEAICFFVIAASVAVIIVSAAIDLSIEGDDR